MRPPARSRSPSRKAALPAVGRAAAAMELLGGLNQWRQGNRGPETDSLIDIGTTGLRDYALIVGTPALRVRDPVPSARRLRPRRDPRPVRRPGLDSHTVPIATTYTKQDRT